MVSCFCELFLTERGFLAERVSRRDRRGTEGWLRVGMDDFCVELFFVEWMFFVRRW